MDLDEKFVEAARSYVGVPFKHQGRSRAGLDCVGLIVVAARECGLNVPMLATYGRTPYYPDLKKELMKFGKREAFIFPGAVIVYKRDTVHIAIATGQKTIIQALNSVGRVTESTLNFVPSQYWRFAWPSQHQY